MITMIHTMTPLIHCSFLPNGERRVAVEVFIQKILLRNTSVDVLQPKYKVDLANQETAGKSHMKVVGTMQIGPGVASCGETIMCGGIAITVDVHGRRLDQYVKWALVSKLFLKDSE